MLEKADRLKLENETLEDELAKTLAQIKEVENEMAETRQMFIDNHNKQISDIKKANDQIKVCIRQYYTNLRCKKIIIHRR